MRQADRIILNTLANYGLSVVQVGAALILVPTVMGQLGEGGYGVVSLVTTIWAGFSIFSNCIGRAMQRFLPLDLADPASGRLSRTFSTCVAGYFVIGFSGALAVWFMRDWLLTDPNLTPQQRADGRWAFAVSCAWLAIGLAGFAYQKGLECLQRYELTGLYVGGTTVLRTLILIAAFWFERGTVTLYVAVDLGASVVACLLCRRTMLRLMPDLKESVRLIDRKAVTAIAAFAGVTLVVIVGNVLGAHGFRVLVSKRLGMDQLAALAVVLTITTLMWRLINDLSNVLAPAVSHLDARGDATSVGKLLVSGTKYSVAVAATMCLVPLAMAGDFFHLWVGDKFKNFQDLNTLATVLLSAQVLLCLGATALQVLLGLGKLQLTGPIMFGRGALALLAAFVYLQWIGSSLVTAAVCLYAVQVLGELAIFTYACGMTRMPRLRSLAEALLRPVALATAGSITTWLVSKEVGTDGWWKLGVSVAAGELVFLAIMLLAGLSREERSHLLSFAGRAWQARAKVSGLWVRRPAEPTLQNGRKGG